MLQTIIGTDIYQAASLLAKGEAVAIPTETVYGLGCNTYSDSAVRNVFNIKGRPTNNPLIVHCYDINAVGNIAAEVPDLAYRLFEHFSPGPLSIVFPKGNHIPDIVTAGNDTVAIRIPNHPVTRQLLELLPFPVAAPSANKFMSVSPTSALHVHQQLNGLVPYILDGGEADNGIESTVVKVERDTIIVLRQGSVTVDELQQVSKNVITGKPDKKLESPGLFKKHYSPNTQVILSTDDTIDIDYNNTALLTFGDKEQSHKYKVILNLSPTGNMREAAKNLYKYLHDLDALNLKYIVVELLPDIGLGAAINDRLKRAATIL